MIPAKPPPEVKLLSCPFCGAQPIGSADTWTVNHKNTCFMGEYTSLDYYSDIERWNRRVPSHEAELRDALHQLVLIWDGNAPERLCPFAKDAARSALLKARTKQENQ